MPYFLARYIFLLAKSFTFSSALRRFILLATFASISSAAIIGTVILSMQLTKSFDFTDFISFSIVQLFLTFSIISSYTLLRMKVYAFSTKRKIIEEFLKKNNANKSVIYFSFYDENDVEENYCEFVFTKGSKAEELLESPNNNFVKKWKTDII